ncbi:MAG: Mut7-C RNAse domain-containing protein [Candidatus Geothermincolales bacterium]
MLSDTVWEAGLPSRIFLADRMLGKLARYMRFLGYDVEYAPEVDDSALLAQARKQGRVLLTRDRGLASRWGGGRDPRVILLSSDKADEQLVELARMDILPPPGPPRCTHCNHGLEEIPSAFARHLVHPYTASVSERFQHCRRCNHVYWEGDHPRLFLDGPGRVLAGKIFQLR